MPAPILTCLFVTTMIAAGAGAQTIEEIQNCMADNAPERSSIQTVVLRSHDRGGEVTETSAKIYWKRVGGGEDLIAVHVTEPASRRGSAVLLKRVDHATSMWAYMPAIRRVRRITERSVTGSMFGTDITYEDFERLQRAVTSPGARRLDDGTVDGRSVYVIEERLASEEGSAYERVVTMIDKERCLALRTELFERGDNLRKVFTTPEDGVRKESCGWIPRVMRIEDVVDRTKTDIVLQRFEPDADFHDSKVSLSALDKGES